MKTLTCAALLLLASSAAYPQDTKAHSAGKPVTVNLINAQGQTVGTATLTPAATGVKITLDVKNLPPGNTPFTFTRMESVSRRTSNPPVRTLTLAATPTAIIQPATFPIFL